MQVVCTTVPKCKKGNEAWPSAGLFYCVKIKAKENYGALREGAKWVPAGFLVAVAVSSSS